MPPDENRLISDAEWDVLEVLWERETGIAGTTVRDRMVAGDETWRDLVPMAVESYLSEIEFRERLLELLE